MEKIQNQTPREEASVELRRPSSKKGFPGGTSGKEPAYQCRRHKRRTFNPWVRKILWRKAWQPTPVFLPPVFMENPMDREAWWATIHKVAKRWTQLKGLSISSGGGNGNALQYSSPENPLDRGAWQAAVHGVTRVGQNSATKPPAAAGLCGEHRPICNSPTSSTCRSLRNSLFVTGAVCLSHDDIPWVSNSCSD